MFPSLLTRHLLGSLVVAGIAGSLLLSLAGGHPAVLPGAALGSTALLYIEKATACFTSYLLVLVVAARAFAGDLPSELRGIRYAVDKGYDESGALGRLVAADEGLHERINQIERVVARSAAQ